MLINSIKLLNDAKSKKYAIPQFNINGLEWTRYILEASSALNSPVIIGVSEGAAKYIGGYKTVYNIVSGLMVDLKITIPVVLHLDHGSDIENCKQAIDSGFTSVMIDASKFEIEKNIKITKEVVKYAKKKNVSVEAEVGHIGGNEDGIRSSSLYAKEEDCVALINQTNINSLAPAVGSVHGLYEGEPKLDFGLILKIKNKTNLPLVLHGGTGIPDDFITKAIESGITKININTELQLNWATAVRKYINDNEQIYDPRLIISAGEKAIKDIVNQKIMLLGSINKG